MILQEIDSYSPSKEAHFVNKEHPEFDIHQNSKLFCYSNRQNELVLKNFKTGRAHVIFRSEHGIVKAKFTNQLLLCVEKGFHEIWAFSLKTEKIKKKVTGHRSQVTCLRYCRQNSLICSISHQVCLIHNQKNLQREKMLKCSTSSFLDATFAGSGQYLFTLFKDSTIFVWQLSDYTYKQYQLPISRYCLCCNQSTFLAAYSSQNLLIANFSRLQLQFQNLELPEKGKIIKVQLIGNIIAIKTSKFFFMAEVSPQLFLEGINKIETQIDSFCVGEYGDILLAATETYKNFRILRIEKGSIKDKKMVKNPLTNKGLHCCGGYSNKEGCNHQTDLEFSHPYTAVSHQLQLLTSTTYKNPDFFKFDQYKLFEFVRKQQMLPDKYRAAAYKFLLKLPINSSQYREIERKGRHPCVQFLHLKYPLKNNKLMERMKGVISTLAHHNPILAVASNVPKIVFPFVCLLGYDQFLCFQVLIRLFNHWLFILYSEFPTANSSYLQSMREILQAQDQELLNHLDMQPLLFTKLAWGLLQSFFTVCLPRQAFLAIVDNLFVRPHQTNYLLFACLGYLIYNRQRILSIQNQGDAKSFLQNEHTVNTTLMLQSINVLHQKHRQNIHCITQHKEFSFQYIAFNNYPKDSLKMYEGKSIMQAEQMRKKVQEQIYSRSLIKQIKKIRTNLKKQADRQKIQQQAYILHQNNEKKQQKVSHPTKPQRMERIQNIERLIDSATQMAETSTKQNNALRGNSPAVNTQCYEKPNQDLERLEQKLMKTLADLNCSSIGQKWSSQPLTMAKQSVNKQMGFKAAVVSKMSNDLAELRALELDNQKCKWDNDMLKSIQ